MSRSRLQRITLILFVIVVTNWAMASLTGYSIIGGDLFLVFLIFFLVVLAVGLVWLWFGKWFSKS